MYILENETGGKTKEKTYCRQTSLIFLQDQVSGIECAFICFQAIPTQQRR